MCLLTLFNIYILQLCLLKWLRFDILEVIAYVELTKNKFLTPLTYLYTVCEEKKELIANKIILERLVAYENMLSSCDLCTRNDSLNAYRAIFIMNNVGRIETIMSTQYIIVN